MAEYCAQHAPDGRVDVYRKKRRTEGCGKQPSFGLLDTNIAEYCAQHAQDEMVDVKNRKCKTEGCPNKPSFRVAGSKTEGCPNKPSFRVAGSKTAEYCAQHAQDWMIDVKKAGRSV